MFAVGLIHSSGSGIGNGSYPRPNQEETDKGKEILRTLHFNLESMIKKHNLKVDNAGETNIVYEKTFGDSPFLHPTIKTNFGEGKLKLLSKATIGSGQTELSNPTAEINIIIERQNVFFYDDEGDIRKVQSYELPILTEKYPYGKIWPFLLEKNNPEETKHPPDKIVTPHINMIVEGLVPIFNFFSGETGWKHYVSNERIISDKGFSLTVTSNGIVSTRKTVIHGDTECNKFKIEYLQTKKEEIDIETLKTNIREYLNTPQIGFFARYQSLTERVARLME